MHIIEREVHLWTLSLNLSEELLADAFATLTLDEQQKANKFKFLQHKNRYIAARYQLRHVLSHYLTLPASDIPFGYGPQGKPFLDFPTDIHFNLSHSHDLAILGISKSQAIGVDIEKIQATYNSDIAERYFSASENHLLNQLSETERCQTFFKIWTRKESVIKALGEGIFSNPTRFSVGIEDSLSTVEIDDIIFSLIPIRTQEGYEAAVTAHPETACINYWHFIANHAKLQKVQDL